MNAAISEAPPNDDGKSAPASNIKRTLLILGAIWIGGVIVLFLIFGSAGRNNSYQPQNEFKLDNWVNLGIFSINKAVLYLFLAAIATCVTMIYIARRMQARPNKRADRRRGALPADAREHHRRQHEREDGPALVPVHRHAVPVHLLLEPDRLHPAADEHRAQDRCFGLQIPSFSLYAATANLSIPLVLALTCSSPTRSKGFAPRVRSAT